MTALEPLGDRAFLARFDGEAEAWGWAESVRVATWRSRALLDVVLAYRAVAIHADPDRVDLEGLGEKLVAIPAAAADRHSGGELVVVPVLYDGEDLAAVAAALGLTIGEVVALHSGRDYRVMAVGFLPGFPYAGDLDSEARGSCPAPRSAPEPASRPGRVAHGGDADRDLPGPSPPPGAGT